MTERTCLKCGWVAFGVTREHAEAEVRNFNSYFAMLPALEQQKYYGGQSSSIKSYETCFFCGGPHTNFRDTRPGEAPDGVTMQPIIIEAASGP